MDKVTCRQDLKFCCKLCTKQQISLLVLQSSPRNNLYCYFMLSNLETSSEFTVKKNSHGLFFPLQRLLCKWLRSAPSAHTLRSNSQRLTLPPLLTSTVDTMYCNVVFMAYNETSQFILCDTGIGDVQKPPIWCLESISGNVNEVEISTVSTT